MTTTVQQIIDRARYTLNDPDKTRYPDAELLDYTNDALLVMRKKRPDLFIGQWAALPSGLALGANWPTSDEYTVSVQAYIIARAEAKEDEYEDTSRAAQFVQAFEAGVFGP